MWAVTLGGVVYPGRPLSGEAVRRFYRDMASTGEDQAAQDALLLRLMRKMYPLRWRNLWDGDPARRFVRDPLRVLKLAQLLVVPDDRPKRPMDEWDKLEAMQRVEDPDGPKVTLETVCGLAEVVLGAGWYHDPRRWPTVDGFAPYDEVWRAWRVIQQARAWDRMNMVRAIGITKAGDKAQAMFDSDVREALGG